MRLYNLTYPYKKSFAIEIANRINKDYPDQAIISETPKGWSVLINPKYFEFCCSIVQLKCRTTNKEPSQKYIEKANLIKEI